MAVVPRRPPTRRRYLRTVGAALVPVALVGCVDDEASPGGATESEASPGASEAPTGTRAPGGSTAPADGASPDGSTTDGETATAGATAGGTATVHADYETTEVAVRTPGGEVLGTVTAAIADTPELRYLGLSDTASLPEDRGMLFVYDAVGDHTYVMREMDFGLDIVYADGEGAITRIHHAPAPGPTEDGNDQRYPGRGQYVLEVNRGWTTERDVAEGDVLEFEL